MKPGPALVERGRRGDKPYRDATPLLPVPVHAMRAWNRTVRDWIQS